MSQSAHTVRVSSPSFRVAIIGAFLAAFFTTDSARSDVSFLGKDRFVSVESTGAIEDSGFVSAAGFDPFNGSVNAGEPSFAAGATQLSTLTPGLISYSASADVGTGFLDWRWGDDDVLSMRAESWFEVDFSVSRATRFSLSGVLDIQRDTGGTSVPGIGFGVSLADSTGHTLIDVLFPSSTWYDDLLALSLDGFGILTPGDYRLTSWLHVEHTTQTAAVSGNWFGGGGSASASFDVAFHPVPIPGAASLGVLGLGMLPIVRRRFLKDVG